MVDPVSAADHSLVRREVTALIVRFFVGLVLVSVVIAGIGYLAREPAETLARAFVARLGLAGLSLGTLLADGLHFPVPPQFYMLLGIAAGIPGLHNFATIAGSSLVAGCLGYGVAFMVSRLAIISRVTQRNREILARVFARYGYRGALVASLLPIPYSVLCWVAGLNGMPRRFVALLSLCRIPKLLAFYWLIQRGWALMGTSG